MNKWIFVCLHISSFIIRWAPFIYAFICVHYAVARFFSNNQSNAIGHSGSGQSSISFKTKHWNSISHLNKLDIDKERKDFFTLHFGINNIDLNILCSTFQTNWMLWKGEPRKQNMKTGRAVYFALGYFHKSFRMRATFSHKCNHCCCCVTQWNSHNCAPYVQNVEYSF